MNLTIQRSARQAWLIAHRTLIAVIAMCLVSQSLFADEQTAKQIETAIGSRGIAHALNEDFAVTVQIHRAPAETIRILVTLDEKLRRKV
jgi:hypothetical protein